MKDLLAAVDILIEEHEKDRNQHEERLRAIVFKTTLHELIVADQERLIKALEEKRDYFAKLEQDARANDMEDDAFRWAQWKDAYINSIEIVKGE